MSNRIKNVFTIKDLENLSGIKAHTIRIWEKRYNILEPMRTESNIRYYDTHSLQKLLNISTLNSFGYKISTIAKLPPERVPILVREVLSNKTLANHVINSFKLAMINFDQQLFFSTYNSLLAHKSFRDIFYESFLPLLDEIGYLWQTETITPAHEHFISALIKQKLASNTEKLQLEPPTRTDRTYVLYLPENEIHEIGLMFLNYELMLNGCKTVYIGESVPLDAVKDTMQYFDNITFVSYFTVAPSIREVNGYIEILKKEVLSSSDTKLYLFGKNAQDINPALIDDNIMIFKDIRNFAAIL